MKIRLFTLLNLTIVLALFISGYTPALAATATPTPTATSPSTFPSAGVLDSFNRANGGIGGSWSGVASGYGITANQLDVGSGGDIYWNATSFGTDQEAYVTVTTVDPSADEIDLLLKAQSNNNYSGGLIEVWYGPGAQRVQVWTYTSAQGWVQRGADIPVTLANGDQFGARAKANGTVEVYRNGALLATRDVTGWPFYANGGYVGLWLLGANNAVLDSFGGGT